MDGYILILAIIVLGGVIATLGDRIGSRVGKARLSLFNLRPKKTAVLVTILTGSVISASTMGILLAVSQQFRDGVFRIGKIQRQLRDVKAERKQVLNEKQAIEDELASARNGLKASTRRLKQVNRSLSKAIARQKQSETKLRTLQSRFQQAQENLRQAAQQVKSSQAQIQQLAAEERQLRSERQRLLQQRNQVQERLKQEQIRLKQEQVRLQQAEAQLNEARQQFQVANAQRAELQEVITALEQSRTQLLQGIRLGTTTIRTGQVLASAVVQGLTNELAARQAVNALLSQARQRAIALTKPQDLPANQQVVQITSSDAQQLVQQISDGEPYLVRILSAANYLEGEQSVIVVPQVAPNRVVFEPGTRVASISVNPTSMSDEELLSRLETLFRETNRRAVAAGLLPEPLTGAVGSFQQINLFRFLLALKDIGKTGSVEILAITPETIYVAGPLKLELIAVQNQEILLRSR